MKRREKNMEWWRRYGSSASQLCLHLWILLMFRLLPMASTKASALPLNQTQETIMRDLAILVSSIDISIPSRWDTKGSNPCLWTGVTCSASESSSFSVVTNLNLSKYSLSNSTILACVCPLDTLQSLDLSGNKFADLPDQFFAPGCSIKVSLTALNVSSNRLAGPLSDFSGFSQLEVLDLSFNSLSGTVGTKLSSLPLLRSLNLSSNKLDGDAPANMVHTLEELALSGNQFCGNIPRGLFQYGNLTHLDLSQNNLTGDVPDEFSKLPRLNILLLSGNIFSGTVPKSLSDVVTLYWFAANQNNFSGPIPSGISRHMGNLDLSYNRFGGELPSDQFLAPSLESVDLTSNLLEGRIPTSFSQKRLFCIMLAGNMLNGTIPEPIEDASDLAYLELNKNHLTGVIPWQVSKCKKFCLLNLASNKLQGPIPDQLGNLDNLVVLKLEMNNLDGHIPGTFSGMLNLDILNLSHNSFDGEIPQGIVQLTKLSILNLQGNRITGTIPISISSLQNLIGLNLASNKLNGTIPTMPISLSTLLNLSHNHLCGSIPSKLGTLPDLEILDLSYNNLSGPVPSSLRALQSLTLLILSYNDLSGACPSFRQHVAVKTTGNPDLCVNIAPDAGTGTEDYRSAIWVARGSFVCSFVISFYGYGISRGLFRGALVNSIFS